MGSRGERQGWVCGAGCGPAHAHASRRVATPPPPAPLDPSLLLPPPRRYRRSWDVFAALGLEVPPSTAQTAHANRTTLRELARPTRVRSALARLAPLDSVLYTRDDLAPIDCPLLCDERSKPPGNESCSLRTPSLASLVFEAHGVEQCSRMIEAAERARNTTYSHVVRLLPSALLEAPLPPPARWPPSVVLTPSGGAADFAVVPRAHLRSYFTPFSLLAAGCPLLRAGVSWAGAFARSTGCTEGEVRPGCLAR